MLTYIIRRLLLVPVLLFGVTLIIFGMLQFLGPVERSALYVKDFPKNEKQIQGIIRKYGLDQPFYYQYWRWLVGHPDPVTGNREGGIFIRRFWLFPNGLPTSHRYHKKSLPEHTGFGAVGCLSHAFRWHLAWCTGSCTSKWHYRPGCAYF